MKNRARSQRKGVVLLIALAMLGLFSILIISYVIATGQVAAIAEVEQSREVLPVEVALEEAAGSLIYGSADHHSASHTHSLLDDLYGNDGVVLRVGNRRGGGGPNVPNMPVDPSGYDARGFLLRPTLTLFKLPTSLAAWHNDGVPPPEGDVANPINIPTEVKNLDDTLAGRQLTFLEGPLENATFQILRSFGGNNIDGNITENNLPDIEAELAGNVIIDLDQAPATEVEINGVTYDLLATAQSSPGSLLYDVGDDGQPGRAGIDDDQDGSVDEPDEIAFPGSDDFGYRFVINGAPFNGMGSNPEGLTGIGRVNTSTNAAEPVDLAADIELQFNPSLLGSLVRASSGAPGTLPQPDEPWDAADFENLFLAWQPSDHRSSPNVGLYGDPDLDKTVGSKIIPSFHRPSVINYLMNTPIRLPGESAASNAPTFWEINGQTPRAIERLQYLAIRLRRATFRPLNFDHNFGDLDGDGINFDGDPGFTGSNPTPVHVQTIAFQNSIGGMRTRLLQLAIWLTNGPWDVDNDGDGIPDSVWIDLNLPSFISSTGQEIRPLIAPLIEDLDGRINVNQAGNYRQLLGQKFPAVNPSNYNNDQQYRQTLFSLNVFGRGSGIGPAEIDFSHLFDEGTTPPSGVFGPIFHTQTSPAKGVPNFLFTRYGNLLNTRYGGAPLDYATPPAEILANQIKFPGFGDNSDPVALHRLNDQLARVQFPAREETFTTSSAVQGKSTDMYGMSIERKDRYGNAVVDNGTASLSANLNDVLNQPYENGLGDDAHFSAYDFVHLVDQLGGSSDLRELLEDELQRNRSLQNLLTTESRDLDVPETSGNHNLIAFFVSRLEDAPGGELQLHLDRMLAPEFRKGTKLNLNRALGNGSDNLAAANSNLSGIADETFETAGLPEESILRRDAREDAFPQIGNEFPEEAAAKASYTPITVRNTDNPVDFNGYDSDGDGNVDRGNDLDGDGQPEKVANGAELLARHLYCLMFMLVENRGSGDEFVPDFPYPADFTDDADVRNRFVARRLAQWAVNAVDFRDTNAICTRLRYDPNPFDGFQLKEAAENVVWGTERPEVEISETLAFHDKRLRRNLEKEPNPGDPSVTLDGELPVDEDNDPTDQKDPDADMDQFRIPEASAFVEIRSLRSQLNNSDTQPGLPPELYSDNQLDLGRIVGTGRFRSPVWRLAVGEPVSGDTQKSIRWQYDAERVGNKLAKDKLNLEQIDYLKQNAPDDWTDPSAEIDVWREAQRSAAEVRPSPGDAGSTGEFITLTDNDFDPGNDQTNNGSRIRLERFVWFANLAPLDNLNIIASPKSGMKRANVFFNQTDSSSNSPVNAAPLLSPGQYAVVAPRISTVVGQTNNAIDPTFEYSPSPQRIEFLRQNGGNPAKFRLNYHGLNDTDNDPETPRYWEDGQNGRNYHVTRVLPIIAQSLTPNTWAAYRNATEDDEEVSIGFNISAPLADNDYYPAPTYRISDDGANGAYPLVDGYRSYNLSEGYHPDEPFDHKGLGGGAVQAPLAENGWAGVGTHQEAVGVFLQRLADPTEPWHPIDNPYLTMDLAPIDLTTLNGEGDVTELIDRRGNGQQEIADSASTYDPQDEEFTPKVKFDSRRKIPDTSRDRVSTHLVQRGNNQNDLTNYVRQIFTERSALSASFSILRETPRNDLTNSVWNFSLGSMWNDNQTPNDNGIDSFYRYENSWFPYHPGIDVEPYRQTLGFVNREYGRPIGADAGGGNDAADVDQYGRGTPRGTQFLLPDWDDRDFQSPLDLISIPAVSRTGLATTFSPGTVLQDSAKRELPVRFEHLLGFEHNFAVESNADVPNNWSLGRPAPVSSSASDLTGRRAPFELCLDYVSTGEASYLANRWLKADQIKFIQQPTTQRAQIFNRVVEFMQPPFNYFPGLRTPGRINLNTTPDYISPGGNFNVNTGGFLDLGERLDDNSQTGSVLIQHSTIVSDVATRSQVWGGSSLFANGSIFRSMAWRHSTFFDLDDSYGEPAALGQFDRYGEGVDTRFGRGFKAFIESRRGFDSALQSSNSTSRLGNPQLDWRYPTQFAGVFSTAQAAEIPSVQRFMLRKKNGVNELTGVRRRTHDMTVLRPHPDMDQRLLTDAEDNAFQQAANSSAFSLNVESDPTGNSVELPSFAANPEVRNLRMTRLNQSLFDRTLPELHKNFRHMARTPRARVENASRMKNLVTNHSNVFLMRMTVGFFVVDPVTGSLGEEYQGTQGATTRGQATYLVDRSIPVGFIPGEKINFENTILYSIFKQ